LIDFHSTLSPFPLWLPSPILYSYFCFDPSLILLFRSSSLSAISNSPPIHHETSKQVYPHRVNSIWVSSTEICRIQIQTITNQLLITHINQVTNHLVSHPCFVIVDRVTEKYVKKYCSIGRNDRTTSLFCHCSSKIKHM
jgi:hypothetical protein